MESSAFRVIPRGGSWCGDSDSRGTGGFGDDRLESGTDAGWGDGTSTDDGVFSPALWVTSTSSTGTGIRGIPGPSEDSTESWNEACVEIGGVTEDCWVSR